MNLIPAFFIIDQENIGIRKKHAIKHTTYGITPVSYTHLTLPTNSRV